MKKMLAMLFLLLSLEGVEVNSAMGEHSQMNEELLQLVMKRRDLIEIICNNIGDEAIEAYQHWDSIPIRPPMKLSDITRLSSDYGMRKHPILKVMRMHNGIDLAGRLGTEIFSAADGKVTRVKYSKYGYGNQVIVEHSNGYSTRYAHLGNIYVDFGQEIRAGEQVGTLGSTGLSTGPHLHFEVIKDGASIDPLFFSYENDSTRSFDSYKELLTALEENRNAWYVSQVGNVQAISDLKSKEYESEVTVTNCSQSSEGHRG